MLRRLLLTALAGGVGCSGGSSSPIDARGPDARRPDAATRDAIAGECGGDHPFAATLLDFDPASTAPTGVEGATFTVRSQPSRTAVSAADGLVEMCVPVEADGLQQLDVDSPGSYLDGFVHAVRLSEGQRFYQPVMLRAITPERASAFYSQQLGVAFDATKAHVLVVNACDSIEPVLDRPHGTPVAAPVDGGGWSTGSTARYYVLFPNVDVTKSTGTVSWRTSGIWHQIPLAPGKWTTLVACFHWI